ncbi:MAG: FtsW/RodA/SpoVE family cell cycle protein [Prevotellaceae bacterium]|nr:FtsW/RodA/SpoVE family cell cycle protein [Prevotellaceae bacterium]
MHLGPVTGQPLPLFSWGGTSIIITGVSFGILQGLARDNN